MKNIEIKEGEKSNWSNNGKGKGPGEEEGESRNATVSLSALRERRG